MRKIAQSILWVLPILSFTVIGNTHKFAFKEVDIGKTDYQHVDRYYRSFWMNQDGIASPATVIQFVHFQEDCKVNTILLHKDNMVYSGKAEIEYSHERLILYLWHTSWDQSRRHPLVDTCIDYRGRLSCQGFGIFEPIDTSDNVFSKKEYINHKAIIKKD